ncbi:kinase-like protein [Hyaloscypha variabilis]
MAFSNGSKSATSGDRAKLGLEDDRVRICFDRGESFYRYDHPPKDLNLNTRTNSASGSPIETISIILDELEAARIPYPPTSVTHFFLPRDRLFCIMTLERVRLVIASLKCCDNLSSDEKEAFAREVCVGGTMRCLDPCLKLLATLIGSEIIEKFVDFIEDGITDSCLPFEVVPDNLNHIRCQIPKHQHATINNCRQGQRQRFCQWAYTLSSSYFKRPLSGHAHYILGDNDVLPIIQEQPRGPSEVPFRKTKSSEVPDNKEGGFGHVQCVKFHPSHFEFGSYSIRCGKNEEHLFALKRLFAHDVDSFNKELASLLSFQDQDDMHLIRLLVTFEVKRVSEKGHVSSTFYLVFPWAEGDLWHFWKMHQTLDDRIPRCVWMAEQCHLLAVALMYVHNERELHLRRFQDVKKEEHDLYGRHGDVKAENILYFKEENILVIADFGLGRLHTKISRSNQDPKTLERTATYRAPEFDTTQGKISRSCDIFSLGCMFLEFVTWYLAGWDAVSEEFPNYRQEKDIYDFLSDTFFRIEGSPGDTKATIKPKVLEWIQKLRRNSNCNQYVLDFLTLIEKRMLDPDSATRIRSDSLVRKLEVFSRACRTDSDYYKEPRSVPEPE